MSCGNLGQSSVVFNMSLVVILVVHMLVMASGDASESSDTDGSGTNGATGVTSCQCYSATHSSRLTCRTPTYGCDSAGELSHGGSCYRFVTNNSKTRNDAHEYCINRNSHLVYIETQEELEFLQTNASGTPSLSSTDYWIGLIPFSPPTWSDGSLLPSDVLPVTYRTCVYLDTVDSRILSTYYDCGIKGPFICERPKSDDESQDCTGGLRRFGNSCYRFYLSESSQRSWDDAKSRCEDDGSHLLRIQTRAELDYIISERGSYRYFWIDSILREYGWMDGSPALPGLTDTSNGLEGNVCFRLSRAWQFIVGDHLCSSAFGYVCERNKTIGLRVAEQWQGSSFCLPTIPSDLTRLGQSGALCVYRLRDGYSPPILYECESGNFTDECGCITKTSNGAAMLNCSCGFCDLVVDDFQEDSMSTVWPSNFSCSCSVDGTSSSVTVVNGQFTCVPDDLESMTTPVDERPITTDKPMTTVGSGGGGDPAGQTGVPIGIPVGVTLALLFILVALVVGFILWRRRGKRNNKGSDKPLTANTPVAGSNANPTYGLDEDDHVTDDVLKPVAAVRPVVPKSKPNNVYADVKPNDRSTSAAGTSEAESYATIQSAGYTPYKPKGQKDVYTALQGTRNNNEDRNAPIPSTGYTAYKPNRGNDVYTDLKKTGNDDDDDPAVYTPIPNNGPKQDKDDPENEYVDPENVTVAASGQRNGAKGVKAPVLLPKPNNLTKDSGYVDVDAPSVVFSDGSKPSARTKKPSGGSGYVSVDSPSATFHNNQDENPGNDYYFKLEKPTADDEDDYSLASAPGVNDYDTFNRAGGKRPSANSPTDDGVYNLTSVPEDNEYNTFHRPGKRHPSNNAPTDDGLYSLTNPPGDDEYSTFERLGNRGPSVNAPSDEGVYSLTGPPGGDVYSTANRVGKKRAPGAPAINNESEYSTLD